MARTVEAVTEDLDPEELPEQEWSDQEADLGPPPMQDLAELTNPGGPPATPRRIKKLEKDRRILQLRRLGMTWDSISATMKAEGVSITAQGAYQAATKLYRKAAVLVLADAAAAIMEEVDFLDSLTRVLMPRVAQGDIQAVGEVRKLRDQRSRLLDLYDDKRVVIIGGQHVHVTKEQALEAGRERASKLRPVAALPQAEEA